MTQVNHTVELKDAQKKIHEKRREIMQSIPKPIEDLKMSDQVSKEQAEYSQRIKKLAELRKRSLLLFILFCGLLFSMWWLWQHFFQKQSVYTENAYTAVQVYSITPLFSGPVSEVLIHETQQVNEGDVLVKLDDSDVKIALIQAQAKLISAQRRVKKYIADDKTYAANLLARIAKLASSEAALEISQANKNQAQADLIRRSALAQENLIFSEE